MYTREEASQIKQAFWTKFGKYMAPVLSSEGDKINWINYKTGIPLLYFRMNATKDNASIAIEIMHKDAVVANKIYDQFVLIKPMLEEYTGEVWDWQFVYENEHGQQLSKIEMTQLSLNVFKEADWPGIISFLKPRMIALDKFWSEYKMVFETIG